MLIWGRADSVYRSYDIMPDGEQFVVIIPADGISQYLLNIHTGVGDVTVSVLGLLLQATL